MTPIRRAALVLIAFVGAAAVGADHVRQRQVPPRPGSFLRGEAPGPARLPDAGIPFIANRGQTDAAVSFYAHTFGGTVFVTSGGAIVYALPGEDGRPGAALREELLDAAPAAVTGRQPSATRVSSYVGNDPARWQRQLATFGAVSLGEAYPGIEVTLQAHGNNVEKIFHVAPGADPRDIRIRVAGASDLGVDADGRLSVATPSGPVSFSAPVAFQRDGGLTRNIDVAYFVSGDAYAFQLGDYDPALALVIDPALASTFVGGAGDEYVATLQFDAAGNLFAGGVTASANFPATLGAYDVSMGGAGDVFVAKFTPDLTTLVAATFFGGSLLDNMGSIALDSTGNVFLVMRTESTNVPVTAGAFQSVKKGGSDTAIAKFDNTLSTLLASTYLGGNRNDAGCCALSIDVDPSDNVFVTMSTNSTDFPTTVGAYDRTYNDFDTDDAAIAKLNNGLTAMVAGTYVGGSLWDIPYATEIDATGRIWIGGRTTSSNYPITPGAFHGDYVDPFPSYDGFLSRLSNNLTTLEASTYIGSTAIFDILWDIATAADGSVYVALSSESPAFPVTPGAFDTSHGGSEDGVVMHFNATLSAPLAATFLGGPAFERTVGIALDGAGNVHVAGYSQSSSYPVTADALQTVRNPGGDGSDAVYTVLNAALTAVLHSSFIGGSAFDVSYRPVFDAAGNVYLQGYTASADFPVSAGAYDTSHNGATDGWVLRYGPLTPPNTDPGADAGDDQSVSCDDRCEAHVTLDGSGSADADGDALSYAWTGPFGTASGVAPTVTLGVGTHEITLTVDDGNGGESGDTVTITVADTTAPVFTTTVGPFNVSITDIAGTPFTVPLPVAGDNCTTVLVTHDAPALFPPGDTLVTFTATDAAGNAATATTTVTVGNSAPVAAPAAVSVDEDGSLAIVLGGTDADGHALSFIVSSGPANGTLSGVAPVLTYSPNVNFNGSDSLTFSVDDGFGGTSNAVVSIAVAPINDAPVAAPVHAETPYQTPVALTLSATDVDGDALTYVVTAPPDHGTLAGEGASLTYTPNAGYSGPDGFAFSASDGHGGLATALVYIVVGPAPPPPPPENRPPVAVDDAASVRDGAEVTIAVVANDSDADGDALHVTAVSTPGFGTAVATPAGDVVYHANLVGSVAFTLESIGGLTQGQLRGLQNSLAAAARHIAEGRTTAAASLLTEIARRIRHFAAGNPRAEALAAWLEALAAGGASDTFTYTVSDGNDGSATATVRVSILLQ